MTNKIQHCQHQVVCGGVCVMVSIQCPTVLLHRVNTNNGDKIKANKNKVEVSCTFTTAQSVLQLCSYQGVLTD